MSTTIACHVGCPPRTSPAIGFANLEGISGAPKGVSGVYALCSYHYDQILTGAWANVRLVGWEYLPGGEDLIEGVKAEGNNPEPESHLCKNSHPQSGILCDLQVGHAGEHVAHSGTDGSVLAKWETFNIVVFTDECVSGYHDQCRGDHCNCICHRRAGAVDPASLGSLALSEFKG